MVFFELLQLDFSFFISDFWKLFMWVYFYIFVLSFLILKEGKKKEKNTINWMIISLHSTVSILEYKIVFFFFKERDSFISTVLIVKCKMSDLFLQWKKNFSSVQFFDPWKIFFVKNRDSYICFSLNSRMWDHWFFLY